MGEELREGKSVVLTEGPSQPSNRSKDVEQRNEQDDNLEDHEDGRHSLRVGGVHVNPNNGHSTRGVGNGFRVAEAIHDDDEPDKLHYAV